jgi:hypothetical protein
VTVSVGDGRGQTVETPDPARAGRRVETDSHGQGLAAAKRRVDQLGPQSRAGPDFPACSGAPRRDLLAGAARSGTAGTTDHGCEIS